MRVELDRVCKSFGRLEVLREISLTLEPGARVALVGPNGAGKSTLVRAILGMLSYRGTVRLDGLSPQADRAALAPRMAYVPQVAPSLAAPVREVLRTICALRGIDADQVAEVARRIELDVAAIARKPFRSLSGGMKQKLLIALALSSGASLLLLDEPTASLDTRGRAELFQLLEELPQLGGAAPTLILSSHRLEEIRRLVDQVIALTEGVVTYHGGAADYLGEQARSVISVLPENGAALRLQEMGFLPSASGWWELTSTHERKMDAVRQIMTDLGTEVLDLTVRDLESVDPEGTPAGGNGGSGRP